MHPLAPEAILRAALHVLHIAGCATRNGTFPDGWSRQQVNDLWEALHPVPGLLTRWRPDAEQELFLYFDEYDAKWPAPRLRAMYALQLSPCAQAEADAATEGPPAAT